MPEEITFSLNCDRNFGVFMGMLLFAGSCKNVLHVDIYERPWLYRRWPIYRQTCLKQRRRSCIPAWISSVHFALKKVEGKRNTMALSLPVLPADPFTLKPPSPWTPIASYMHCGDLWLVGGLFSSSDVTMEPILSEQSADFVQPLPKWTKARSRRI